MCCQWINSAAGAGCGRNSGVHQRRTTVSLWAWATPVPEDSSASVADVSSHPLGRTLAYPRHGKDRLGVLHTPEAR